MSWVVFLIASAACLLISVVAAIVQGRHGYKARRVVGPIKVLFGGAVAASMLLYMPVCIEEFGAGKCGWLEILVMAFYNMVRLFLVDGDFSFILDKLGSTDPLVYKAYTVLFSVLFVMAPVLTFGFVLSFFRNVSAYVRYLLKFNAETYVFSELNEKSLALAVSLRANNRKRCLVFTGVSDGEQQDGLLESAKELGAVCFSKDILTINLDLHSAGSLRKLFLIGEDQSENTRLALKLLEKLKRTKNTELFVFSALTETELLLSKAYQEMDDDKAGAVKVRRVDEVRSLVQRTLYESGYETVFQNAVQGEDGLRHINALVVGMGQHGFEMARALTWFGQMDGYELSIHVVDADEKADRKFASRCPELIQYSGTMGTKSDACYELTVHAGIDVETADFDELVDSLPQTTYVFVALGSDTGNISAAVKLRSLFERKKYHPVIQTVVFDAEKKEALRDVKNMKKQSYDITCIGDLRSSFTEEVVLASDLEKIALERHMKWGSEQEFWRYEYNYRSSMASAIHGKMKRLCGIPGAALRPDDRKPEDRENLRLLEHRRWNAYMRSEGFVYGGSKHPEEGRNDLAFQHNCLLPFEELLEKDKMKDDD